MSDRVKDNDGVFVSYDQSNRQVKSDQPIPTSVPLGSINPGHHIVGNVKQLAAGVHLLPYLLKFREIGQLVPVLI